MQRKTKERGRKQKAGKLEHRKRKTEKSRIEGKKEETTEVRSERYICAGEISSRDPSEGPQGLQDFSHFRTFPFLHCLQSCLTDSSYMAWSKLPNNIEGSQ